MIEPARLNDAKSLKGSLLEAAAVVLGCYAFFVIYFSPVLFSNQFIAPDDGRIQNLAAFYGAHSLWTPQLYCGLPLAADPLVQMFYPVANLLRLLHLGWNFYVVSGYALAGACAYLFVKEVAKSRFAAVIAAIVHSMSGYLFAEVIHVHVQQVHVYIPLSLWLVEKLSRDSKPYLVAFGALTLAFAALNGQMQYLVYIGTLAGFYALYRLFDPKTDKKRFLSSLFLVFGLGSAAAAVQVLPSAEWAKFSAREHFSFDDFLTYSMNPVELVGALSPYLFGSDNGLFFHEKIFWPGTPSPFYCYIGMLPLIFFVLSLSLLHSDKLVRFFVAVMFVSLLLALGKATPLAWILYHIPPFGSFRALYRFLALTNFSCAVLCGTTALSLSQSKLKQKQVIMAVAGVALVSAILFNRIVAVGAFLNEIAAKAGNAPLSFLPWTNPAVGLPCIFLVLAGGAVFLLMKRPQAIMSKIAVVAVILCDLGLTGWYSVWRAEPVSVDYLQAPPHAAELRSLLLAKHQRVLPVRGGSGERDELPPNISRFWKIPSASGYEPLMPTRYGDLLGITEGGFLKPPWHLSVDDRSFDILAIRYALTEKDDERLLSLNSAGAAKVIWKRLKDEGEAGVYENERALPRTWLCSEVIPLAPEDVIKAIKTSRLPDGRTYAPGTMALVESPSGGNARSGSDSASGSDPRADGSKRPGKSAGSGRAIGNWSDSLAKWGIDPEAQATISRLDNTLVEIDVSSSAPSFLVLSDTFYPGWLCEVDGKACDIVRADYVLRGVALDKGRHKVTFRFSPKSVFVGAAISVLALLAILGLFIVSIFRFARRRDKAA